MTEVGEGNTLAENHRKSKEKARKSQEGLRSSKERARKSHGSATGKLGKPEEKEKQGLASYRSCREAYARGTHGKARNMLENAAGS